MHEEGYGGAVTIRLFQFRACRGLFKRLLECSGYRFVRHQRRHKIGTMGLLLHPLMIET